jgi:hypothetical protein
MRRLTCAKRGHDTSYPEARDSSGHCKACVRIGWREFDKSPLGRYQKLKRELRREIKRIDAQILGVERLLSEQEN